MRNNQRWIMVDGRVKGRNFEYETAKNLEDELGIKFKRDIEQYRQQDRGDLLADDPDWPFVIECKRYSKGNGCNPAWQKQATSAAIAANKMPVVIYKYNHREVVCSLPMEVINPMYRGCGFWADISFGAFCYIAREWMAKNEPDTF